MNIELPEGLKTVKISYEERNLNYHLVVGKELSDYEKWQVSLAEPEANTQLILDLLGNGGGLVDVGANIGTIAAPALAAGAECLGIELLPVNCLRLALMAKANGFSKFQVIQTAVGDSDCLMNYEGAEAWGCVTANQNAPVTMCLQLDTILEHLSRPLPDPLVFKLDVEGYEAPVLRGAVKVLNQKKPPVVFESIEIYGECSPGYDARQELAKHGYELFLIKGKTLIPRSSQEPQEEHIANFLAYPQGKSDALKELGYDFRSTSIEESIQMVSSNLGYEIVHQRHAAGLILHWYKTGKVDKAMVKEIAEKLVTIEDLGELRQQLKSTFLES